MFGKIPLFFTINCAQVQWISPNFEHSRSRITFKSLSVFQVSFHSSSYGKKNSPIHRMFPFSFSFAYVFATKVITDVITFLFFLLFVLMHFLFV